MEKKDLKMYVAPETELVNVQSEAVLLTGSPIEGSGTETIDYQNQD